MSDAYDTVEHLDLRPDWGPEEVGDYWGEEDAPTAAEEAGDPWPPAPRCPLGKLVAYHPPTGQPCACGLILDKEIAESA